MSDAEKFIVVQFKKGHYGIVPGDMRTATSQASAEKMASAMARITSALRHMPSPWTRKAGTWQIRACWPRMGKLVT